MHGRREERVLQSIGYSLAKASRLALSANDRVQAYDQFTEICEKIPP
jgi:hypothetical protein